MSDTRPNIVMILTDHWRGDSLGRLGHPVAETPHLDELSAGGATFTEAYTPVPSCIAARRSLMTGQTPDTHGMLGYKDGCAWPYRHTLAGELAKVGYQTINVGKTHFHPKRLHLGYEELITPQDYDEWIREKTGLVRARFAHGVHANSWMGRPHHLPETQMIETWLTNEAMKRLEKRDTERPFFMTLSFNGPHPPWCPPAVYFDLFMRKDIPGPTVGAWAQRHAEEPGYPLGVNAWQGRVPPELIHRARAAYFAYLAYIDAQIGRFIEFLGRSGLRNNLMILFTSDHGEMLGDHNLWRKTYAYDASARIPLIIQPPRTWDGQRNIEIDQPVGLEDVMPTLLEAAGVLIPDTVEGRSLWPLLDGSETEWREYYQHEHSPCYAPDNAYLALTNREWKYVWNPITGAEQLFQRSQDRFDEHDLAQDPDYTEELELWRGRMVQELAGRTEGFSDGKHLTPAEYPVWRSPISNI